MPGGNSGGAGNELAQRGLTMTKDMKQLTEDAKAILLLCGRFGESDANGTVKPLSLGEYNRIADWMVDRKLRPADLLKDTFDVIQPDSPLNIDGRRIQKLLSRGGAMALAVEKWTHNGIWIVCRSDEGYPQRLKKQLKKQAPPVLFGVGDPTLLSAGGLAIVGSRNVDAKGEVFTHKVAEACAECGMAVVSGGARGVDQTAMLSTLNAGGRAIGVLADSLQKAAVAGKYRSGIRERRLVLVSPFFPDARFNVGNAMGRNKYIYALSDFALIVSAEVGKGGTWTGAMEELKRGSKSVYVRVEAGVPEGNSALLNHGAEEFPPLPWNNELKNLLSKTKTTSKQISNPSQQSLFGLLSEQMVQTAIKEERKPFSKVPEEPDSASKTEAAEDNVMSIYDAIKPVLLDAVSDWISSRDLAEKLGIRKVQMEDWLKRAVKEGVIAKKNRPVRYRRK